MQRPNVRLILIMNFKYASSNSIVRKSNHFNIFYLGWYHCSIIIKLYNQNAKVIIKITLSNIITLNRLMENCILVPI